MIATREEILELQSAFGMKELEYRVCELALKAITPLPECGTSPTPRTDATFRRYSMDGEMIEFVSADFARQLERELAEAIDAQDDHQVLRKEYLVRAEKAEAALSTRGTWLPWDPDETARRFHEAYEEFAPHFGYTTREDTRQWDPNSANAALMIAVVRNVLIEQASRVPSATGKRDG